MSYKEGMFVKITDTKEGEGWTLHELEFDNGTTKAFNNLKSKNTKQVDELIPGLKYKYMYNDEKQTAYGFWEVQDKDHQTSNKDSVQPSVKPTGETNSGETSQPLFVEYTGRYIEGTAPEERSLYHFITVYFNTYYKSHVSKLVKVYNDEVERLDKFI